MFTLYHYPLSPFCRKIRLLLKEKDLAFTLITEPFWERRPEFIAMNPAGQVPVLMQEDRQVFADHNAIVEYIEEMHPTPFLLGSEIRHRAEVRRLVGWFDSLFYTDVSGPLLIEKIYKFQSSGAAPDSRVMRAAEQRIAGHMEYIAQLLRQRTWLAGDALTIADLAAAAHLSVLDYFNDIDWAKYPGVKEWYAILKSRPSFRPLLSDRVPGFRPPNHYPDLDF